MTIDQLPAETRNAVQALEAATLAGRRDDAQTTHQWLKTQPAYRIQ